MVYGLVFKDYGKEVQPLSISESMFGVSSIVYDEYANRKILMECLLEETIDNTERIKLEAQLEVLKEISFKDIWEKIKKAIGKIIEFLKNIVKKIKEFFTKNKKKKDKEADKIINSLNDELADSLDISPFLEEFSHKFDNIIEDYKKAADEIKEANKRMEEKHNKFNEDFGKNLEKMRQSSAKNKEEFERAFQTMGIKLEESAYQFNVLNEKNDISNTGSKSADMSIITALFRTASKHPELLIEPDESDFQALNKIVNSISISKDTDFEDIVGFYDAVVIFEETKRDYLKQIEKAKDRARKLFEDHKVDELAKLIQTTSNKLDVRINEYNNISVNLTKKLEIISTGSALNLDSTETLQYYSAMVGVIGKLKDFIAYQVIQYSKASAAATVLWDYICAIKEEHKL